MCLLITGAHLIFRGALQRMPIQAPQWTEFLSCPVCCHEFSNLRAPISLGGCGHTICRTCLATLHKKQCPFDQTLITTDLENLPINHALLQLVSNSSSSSSSGSSSTTTTTATTGTPGTSSSTANIGNGNLNRDSDIASIQSLSPEDLECYNIAKSCIEELALYLKPYTNGNVGCLLSRPMLRKLVTLINCQLVEDEGRARSLRAARSLGERTVTELILQHQNPQQLSTNLWAAVRARGCQFLGPAMQEEVLKLVLLALEDGTALSRKVLVMFVVQRLQPHFLQASKTSIGHVVQLLYRASCFKVSKREGDSSLMQLKEEFRTYEALRREHDGQIVQIATEAGLRIAPDQWSALLYGDSNHKSHMQSIIDKLQTPQSFAQSVQELVIALQRTGDPANLSGLRTHLKHLADIDANTENPGPTTWQECSNALVGVKKVVIGLVDYVQHHGNRKLQESGHSATAVHSNNSSKYKISLCRDLNLRGTCPRGTNCTFAHSEEELERHRIKLKKNNSNGSNRLSSGSSKEAYDMLQDNLGQTSVSSYLMPPPPPHSSSSVEENSPIRFPNNTHNLNNNNNTSNTNNNNNNNMNTKIQSRYNSTKSPNMHQHNSSSTSSHGLPTHQIPYQQNAGALHPPPLVPPSPVNTRFPYSPNHHNYNSYHPNSIPQMGPPPSSRNYRTSVPPSSTAAPPPPQSHQMHSKNAPILYPPYSSQQQQILPQQSADGGMFNALAGASTQSPNSTIQQQFSPNLLSDYGSGEQKIDRKIDGSLRGGPPPPPPSHTSSYNMNWTEPHPSLGISKYNQQLHHPQHQQSSNAPNFNNSRAYGTNKQYNQLEQRRLEIMRELGKMPQLNQNNTKLPISIGNDNNNMNSNSYRDKDLCYDNLNLWNYGTTKSAPTSTPLALSSASPATAAVPSSAAPNSKDTFVRSDSILTDDDTFFDTTTSPSNKFGPISRMNKNSPTNQPQHHQSQYQHNFHNLSHLNDTTSHLLQLTQQNQQQSQQMDWNTTGYNTQQNNMNNNKLYSKQQQQQQHQSPPNNNKNSPTAIINNHLNIKNNNIGGETAHMLPNSTKNHSHNSNNSSHNTNENLFVLPKNKLENELLLIEQQMAEFKYASQQQLPPQSHLPHRPHQQMSHPPPPPPTATASHHHHNVQQKHHHNNHLNHSQHNQHNHQLGFTSNNGNAIMRYDAGDAKHKHNKMKDIKENRLSVNITSESTSPFWNNNNNNNNNNNSSNSSNINNNNNNNNSDHHNHNNIGMDLKTSMAVSSLTTNSSSQQQQQQQQSQQQLWNIKNNSKTDFTTDDTYDDGLDRGLRELELRIKSDLEEPELI